jgi:hypothetical protein
MAIRKRLTSQPRPSSLLDLSDGIRTRLQALESEEETVLKALAAIREKKQAYTRLLELEEGESRPVPVKAKPKRLREVHAIVREKLLEGITNKDEIIAAVEEEGHEKPGRSVNAALMNFKRFGHVEVDGREFNLTASGKDALRRDAEGVK